MACLRRSNRAGPVARAAGAGGSRRTDADAVVRAPPAEPHHPCRDADPADTTRARTGPDEGDDAAARGAALRVGRGVAGTHRSSRRRKSHGRSDQTRRHRLAERPPAYMKTGRGAGLRSWAHAPRESVLDSTECALPFL